MSGIDQSVTDRGRDVLVGIDVLLFCGGYIP